MKLKRTETNCSSFVAMIRNSRGHGNAARGVGDPAPQEQRRQEQERRRNADPDAPFGAHDRHGAQQLVDERFLHRRHQQRRRRRGRRRRGQPSAHGRRQSHHFALQPIAAQAEHLPAGRRRRRQRQCQRR